MRRKLWSAAILAWSIALAGCGETSRPYAIQQGCYYAEDGTPVLRIRGEEGVILTPPPRRDYPNSQTRLHLARVRALADSDGPHLEVTPSFYLTDPPGVSALSSSVETARFRIIGQRANPTIMVGAETYGEVPITLGPPC
ncbi:MAG TPA: hypothetical protein VIT38_11595 [Allosphingosinicella sp.]|jgi:hypothetical protein